MSKVIFEFNENKDRDDINIIVNRHKIVYALQQIQDLHRKIYNGKLYDDVTINVKDGKVLTEEDYKRFQEDGEYPVKGTKEYLDSDYIERELDSALEHIYNLLDY